jgi:hypothetical protein
MREIYFPSQTRIRAVEQETTERTEAGMKWHRDRIMHQKQRPETIHPKNGM